MSVAHYLMNGVAQCIQIQIATGLFPFSFFLLSFLLCFLCVYFSSHYVEMRVDIPAMTWASLPLGVMYSSRQWFKEKKKEWTTWCTWKTADSNSWIAWKTKLDLWSNFGTDKNLHGSAFRLQGTCGTVQVFEETGKCACFCPDLK